MSQHFRINKGPEMGQAASYKSRDGGLLERVTLGMEDIT